ncbi:MAG: hypothetical protein ACI31S_04390 [Bacilli bacterium]
MNNNIFDTDIEFLEKIKLLIELNKFELPSNEQIKIVLKKIEKLANAGWLLPSYETSDEHWKFLNNIDNQEKLNNLFIEYFKRDNNLQKTIDKFNTGKRRSDLKDLYNQALFLYNNHMFSGAVTILFALYEALIREQINYEDKNSVSSNINYYLSKKYTDKRTIIFQDRKGIGAFTEKIFSKVDFDKIDDSNYFNRNVILHGMDYKRITEIDVLKMLNAIDILEDLICGYEKFWEVKDE